MLLYTGSSSRADHMQAFRVSGKFRMGHIITPFTLETVGADETAARDRVYATIGSRHRVSRHQITLEKIQTISGDAITDPVVEKRLSMVK